MKKTYTIIVHKENNIYWGECPELRGCFAQAKSVEQLKKLMMESIYKIYWEKLKKHNVKQNIVFFIGWAG